MDSSKSYHPWGWVAFTAAVASGVVTALLTGAFSQDDPAPQTASDATTTSRPSGPTEPTPSEADPSPPTPQEPSERYLTDEDPVASSSDVDVDETAEVSGTPLLHSVIHSCSLFCNDQVGSIAYNLGGRYSTFTATIGVTDDAEDIDQLGAFTVLLDGAPVKSWTVKFGEARQIDVDVTGALRLELQSGRQGTVAGSPADSAMAGANAAAGVSNGLPSLAWGSPTLQQ